MGMISSGGKFNGTEVYADSLGTERDKISSYLPLWRKSSRRPALPYFFRLWRKKRPEGLGGGVGAWRRIEFQQGKI